MASITVGLITIFKCKSIAELIVSAHALHIQTNDHYTVIYSDVFGKVCRPRRREDNRVGDDHTLKVVRFEAQFSLTEYGCHTTRCM